jgi:hypothetical protein
MGKNSKLKSKLRRSQKFHEELKRTGYQSNLELKECKQKREAKQ